MVGSTPEDYFWSDTYRGITSFFYRAQPSQLLLFYFSGYAIPLSNDIYLATPRVNPKQPMVDGFSFSELMKIMQQSRSTRIVCIIDACYSGITTFRDSQPPHKIAKNYASRAQSIFSSILDKMTTLEGVSILLSNQPYDSFSNSEDGNRTSLYSNHIIGGLMGREESVDKDGNVTPESLHTYVYNRIVNRDTIEHKPVLFNSDFKIVLASYPKLSTKLRYGDILKTLLHEGKIEEFNMLRKENRVIYFDLHGANLQSVNLHGANLQSVNLHDANFTEANLREADLSDADLGNANLTGAKLAKANLQEANLSNANLTGADLSNANLTGADLSNANLTGADLSRITLRGAIIKGSIMTNANFSDADLRSINIQEADLSKAVLENANLAEANLVRANLSEAKLSGIKLTNANLKQAQFAKANLSNATLLGASLHDVTFNEANLKNADLSGADVSGADFKDTDLNETDLYQTELQGAKNLPISKDTAKSKGAIV